MLDLAVYDSHKSDTLYNFFVVHAGEIRIEYPLQ